MYFIWRLLMTINQEKQSFKANIVKIKTILLFYTVYLCTLRRKHVKKVIKANNSSKPIFVLLLYK